MHSSRSAPVASADARSIAASSSSSPNSTTSGFSGRPQSHRGTPSTASSSRRRVSASDTRAPHARHEAVEIEPCTSITSREPAAACRPSMFWVITASSRPAASSAASARWAPFGRLPSSVAKR